MGKLKRWPGGKIEWRSRFKKGIQVGWVRRITKRRKKRRKKERK